MNKGLLVKVVKGFAVWLACVALAVIVALVIMVWWCKSYTVSAAVINNSQPTVTQVQGASVDRLVTGDNVTTAASSVAYSKANTAATYAKQFQLLTRASDRYTIERVANGVYLVHSVQYVSELNNVLADCGDYSLTAIKL